MPRIRRSPPGVLGAALLALAAVAAAPATAHADRGPGAVQLGAGITLLSVQNFPDPGVTSIQYGATPYVLFGARVGYQVADMVLIGLQLSAGGMTVDNDSPFGGSDDTVFFSAIPRVEFLFDISSLLVAYAGLEIGFSVFGDPDFNPADFFEAGAIGGLRIFAEPSFSIDAELGLGFVHNPDSANAGFQATLNLIFSGWIGGAGDGTSADEGYVEPAPAPAPAPVGQPQPQPQPQQTAPPPPLPDNPEQGLGNPEDGLGGEY